MRSASRARSRRRRARVPSVLGGIGTCTGVPCAEPGRDRPPTPSPTADPAPSEVGDAPRRADDRTSPRAPRVVTRGARDRTHGAIHCRTKTKQVPKRLGYIRPVNVGQTASTLKPKRRPAILSFSVSTFSGQNRPRLSHRRVTIRHRAAWPSTSRCHARQTKREHRLEVRAGHFSLFEVCQVFLATRFCTRTSSNRRFDATHARATMSLTPFLSFSGIKLVPVGSVSAPPLTAPAAPAPPPPPLARRAGN